MNPQMLMPSGGLTAGTIFETASDPSAGAYQAGAAAYSRRTLFVYPVLQDIEVAPLLQMSARDAANRGKGLLSRLSPAVDVEL